MDNKRLQKIGRIGEEYIFKNIFKEAEWINEKKEKGLHYDGIIGGIKVDVKTTTAKTYTFNCLWSNHKQYFDNETLFVFVYYNEINNTCIIDFIYKGKELNTYKQIHPSVVGKKDTCYIYRKD